MSAVPEKARRGYQIPGDGVTGSCKPVNEAAVN